MNSNVVSKILLGQGPERDTHLHLNTRLCLGKIADTNFPSEDENRNLLVLHPDLCLQALPQYLGMSVLTEERFSLDTPK